MFQVIVSESTSSSSISSSSSNDGRSSTSSSLTKNKIHRFSETLTVGEIRRTLPSSESNKAFVLVNKHNNRRLAVLCDSEKPSFWMRHIFSKSNVVHLKLVDASEIQRDVNGIEAIKLPHDSREEETSIRLLQYLQREGKRYGYLEISDCESVRGQKWCVLTKERLLFFSPTKTLSTTIRYLPLHITTTCNVVSENSIQIRPDSSTKFCDPITLSTKSRAQAIAWVEAITNRDSVISENYLFESVENQISAEEENFANEDQMILARLETLEGVLRNRMMRTEFEKFLKRESTSMKKKSRRTGERENMLHFWIECERYCSTHPEQKLERQKQNADQDEENDLMMSLSSHSQHSYYKSNMHRGSLPELVQMRRRYYEEPTTTTKGSISSKQDLTRSDSTQIYIQRK